MTNIPRRDDIEILKIYFEKLINSSTETNAPKSCNFGIEHSWMNGSYSNEGDIIKKLYLIFRNYSEISSTLPQSIFE